MTTSEKTALIADLQAATTFSYNLDERFFAAIRRAPYPLYGPYEDDYRARDWGGPFIDTIDTLRKSLPEGWIILKMENIHLSGRWEVTLLNTERDATVAASHAELSFAIAVAILEADNSNVAAFRSA